MVKRIFRKIVKDKKEKLSCITVKGNNREIKLLQKKSIIKTDFNFNHIDICKKREEFYKNIFSNFR